MFESRFSTSTSESFAIGPARVLLDGAVRRHVVVGHTSYQNALSHKRLGNKERGHVYALYSIMFACVCSERKRSIWHKTRRRHFSKSSAVTLWQYCNAVTLKRSTTISRCEDNTSWQHYEGPSNPCYDNSYHRWTSSITPEPEGPVLSFKYHPETSTLAFLHW